MLAARSVRLPRAPAAAAALAGLAMFVLMVGPDASVLRAALMGRSDWCLCPAAGPAAGSASSVLQ